MELLLPLKIIDKHRAYETSPQTAVYHNTLNYNGQISANTKAMAPLTRERNRSTSFHIVPKSGTLKGCVQIEPFRSKKLND